MSYMYQYSAHSTPHLPEWTLAPCVEECPLLWEPYSPVFGTSLELEGKAFHLQELRESFKLKQFVIVSRAYADPCLGSRSQALGSKRRKQKQVKHNSHLPNPMRCPLPHQVP